MRRGERVLLLVLALAAVAIATSAPAQPADDSSRDEAIFGAEAPPAPAPATDDAAREAAIFGDAPETGSPPSDPIAPTEPRSPSPAAQPPGDRDDAVLGGAPTTLSAELARKRLAEAYDRLTVGGLLYLRASYGLFDGAAIEDGRFTTPNLLDVYLDARPSDEVRAYVRGRLRYDPTVSAGELDPLGRPLERSSGAIDQLWLKFVVAHTLFVTLGQQRVKWGAGRFWNPTDFVNQARLDPLAVFDERTGVALVKLHLPIESLGWNLYAIGNFEDASRADELGAALRGELVLGPAELGLAYAFRKDNPQRLGADLSAGVGPIDVRFELALLHGDEGTFYEGELDLRRLVFPRTVDRSDEWIPQAVAGFELPLLYSDQDMLMLGAEYFYNGAGYDDASLYPALLFDGLFEPFYVARHYAAAYFLLPGPGSWDETTFILTGISNLSDRSVVARFDYRVLLFQHLSFDLHVARHLGETGEFRFGLDVPKVPVVPALANGLRIPAPRLEFGGGISVNL